MQRPLLVSALLALSLGAGCSDPVRLVECGDGLQEAVLYLDSGFALRPGVPPPGEQALPGVEQAFLVDAPAPFLSESLSPGIHIVGDVVLELWVETRAGGAPLVLDGDPGEGYHLFNQFGSDRALMPGYAVEYGPALPEPGTVVHYTETLANAPGGFVVEEDDRVRVLLTSLAAAVPGQPGQVVHVGGDTPSHVRFEARCYRDRPWSALSRDNATVSLPAHQGLLTGLVPATEGLNTQTFWFDRDPGTERLTVDLRQGLDPNPAKDDIDMAILDANGTAVYGAGSPAADETAILWEANLEALLPGDRFGVQVASYSGHAYQGRLQVVQERA